MRRLITLTLAAMVALAFFAPAARGEDPKLQFGTKKKIGSTQYTVRLKVVNNSGADAIMWITPPWDKNGIGEPESNFWADANGGKRVCRSADGKGNYVSDMSQCPGNANYFYKIELPAFSEKYLYLPDGGSASNQFFFHMGCTKNPDQKSWNRDFDQCVYGSFFGGTPTPISNELLGSNTLFEATWGCNTSDKTVACNKNPSSDKGALLDNQDWIDISTVDGFTTPVSIKLENQASCQFKKGDKWDGFEEGKFLDVASCPEEDATTVYPQTPNLKTYLLTAKGTTQAANVIGLKTVDNGKAVSCTAPYKILSTQYLGSMPGYTTRPLEKVADDGTKNAHTKMKEINWYGCVPECPNIKDPVDKDCPGMSPAACLKGPLGDGSFSAAKTNYVARLKAMGMKAYTWQFDDDYGSKHCDYGGYFTVTLAPAIRGQIPWDNTVVDEKDRNKTTPYLWAYDPDSNSCTTSTTATAKDGATSNYYDCISAKAKYKIIPDHDTLQYCVPAAPKENAPYTGYDECAKHLNVKNL